MCCKNGQTIKEEKEEIELPIKQKPKTKLKKKPQPVVPKEELRELRNNFFKFN
jgi:hypothetical protein